MVLATAAPIAKVTDQDLAQLAKVLVERLRRIADGPAVADPTRVCPTCGTKAT